MKKHNPNIPIMLREAAGTSPKVYARYEFGQEKSQSLEGTNARMHECTGIYIDIRCAKEKKQNIDCQRT